MAWSACLDTYPRRIRGLSTRSSHKPVCGRLWPSSSARAESRRPWQVSRSGGLRMACDVSVVCRSQLWGASLRAQGESGASPSALSATSAGPPRVCRPRAGCCCSRPTDRSAYDDAAYLAQTNWMESAVLVDRRVRRPRAPVWWSGQGPAAAARHYQRSQARQ